MMARPALWLAIGCSFAVACQSRPRGLAEVGSRPVTLAEFAAFVEAQTGRPLAQISGDLAGALFEGMLEEELVLAASADPTDRNLPPGARSARARSLLSTLCPPPPPPSAAEIDAALAGQAVTGRERVRIRQLVLPDQAAARSARERVRRGEPFDTLSREVSRAPNATTGGLIGWIERGQLPPEFEAAVAGLAVNEVSEPVPSTAGWHVFQVMDRATASADPAARERVEAALGAARAGAARRPCLRALAATVGVRINCAEATFPCRNPFEGTP